MSYLENKRKYIINYRRKNYKTMTITFRYDTESDVIAYLEDKPSRQEFIKNAVKAAIEAEQKK